MGSGNIITRPGIIGNGATCMGKFLPFRNGKAEGLIQNIGRPIVPLRAAYQGVF